MVLTMEIKQSESLIKRKMSESLIKQITLIALIMENKAGKVNL